MLNQHVPRLGRSSFAINLPGGRVKDATRYTSATGPYPGITEHPLDRARTDQQGLERPGREPGPAEELAETERRLRHVRSAPTAPASAGSSARKRSACSA
jgi:hypothetical protein